MEAKITGFKNNGSKTVFQIEITSPSGNTWVQEHRYSAFEKLKNELPDTGVGFPKKVTRPSIRQLEARKTGLEAFLQAALSGFATLDQGDKEKLAAFLGWDGKEETGHGQQGAMPTGPGEEKEEQRRKDHP